MELCSAKQSSDLSAQTDRNQEFYTQIAPQSREVNSLCCLFYSERSSRGSIRLQTSCQSGDRWDRGLLGVWASNRLASVPRSVRPFVRLPEYSKTPACKSLQNGTLRKKPSHASTPRSERGTLNAGGIPVRYLWSHSVPVYCPHQARGCNNNFSLFIRWRYGFSLKVGHLMHHWSCPSLRVQRNPHSATTGGAIPCFSLLVLDLSQANAATHLSATQ